MEELGRLLRRSKQVHNSVWAAEVGTIATPRQHAVLTAVSAKPGLSQAELNDLLDMDRATAGAVIRRLSALGWIDVGKDPSDVRRMMLTLSPEGDAARERLHPAFERVQLRLLELVDPAIAANLVDMLLRVVDRDDRPPFTSLQPDAPSAIRGTATSVGPLLRRAYLGHGELWRRADPVLTAPQFDLLLAAAQTSAQNDLKDLLQLDPASVGQIVEILEKRRLISRSVDPEDARRRRIHVTPQGRALLEELRALADQVAVEFFRPLSAEDRDRFVQAIKDLAVSQAPRARRGRTPQLTTSS